MSAADSVPPTVPVPTLTEVVDIDRWPTPRPGGARTAPAPLPSAEQLVQRVLGELQAQIDVMLEYRLREILGPVLARATDSVVRDARAELASTLRDVVARAVAAELARYGAR